MLAALRKFLALDLTIAEWIGVGILVSTPHLVLGVAWAAANTERFAGLSGIELAAAVVGSILAWPVLLLPNVCPA